MFFMGKFPRGKESYLFDLGMFDLVMIVRKYRRDKNCLVLIYLRPDLRNRKEVRQFTIQ